MVVGLVGLVSRTREKILSQEQQFGTEQQENWQNETEPERKKMSKEAKERVEKGLIVEGGKTSKGRWE